jgi:hypothetical protein
MASGQKREFINSRERAISTDINRMQAFLGASAAEVLRWMYDATATEDKAGGDGTPGVAAGTPLRGVILNGIRPRPEIGTKNLFIEPGVAMVCDPDVPASSDDSPFKVIIDPGVQVAGSLLMTVGGGGATRIDIIECQRSEVVLEVDNRDLFNVQTGLFTPTSVNKVIASQLVYRIRNGVAGAGFPANVAGWMPLAVARVPNTALTWDDCDLWDVRPLASDFASPGGFPVTQAEPLTSRNWTYVNIVGANAKLIGIVDTVQGSRHAGGLLAPIGSFIDLFDTTNVQSQGLALVSLTPWYLYFMFPKGLPRWAKYSTAASGSRIPLSPRGIPVVTQVHPVNAMQPTPVAAFNLPSALFGVATSEQTGVVAATGIVGAGAITINDVTTQNGEAVYDPPFQHLALISNVANVVTFDLTLGTQVPTHVTKIRLLFAIEYTGAANLVASIARAVGVLDAANSLIVTRKSNAIVHLGPPGDQFDAFEVDVPIWQQTSAAVGTTRRFTVTITGTGITVGASCSATVVGFKTGT